MSSCVFIDSRVRNYDLLLASLAPDIRVVILDSTQDGLEQISQALEGVTDLDAIHIISHGAEGTLYLGDTVLTSDNLAEYSSELEIIGAALSEQGDILLYGCEVGNGVTGQTFVENLALYTSADVAASTDYTGNATLNGDWVLEANIGHIEAETIVLGEFDALLAAPFITLPGNLDTSFSADGKVTTAIGADFDIARSLVLQANGKIIAAGNSNIAGSLGDFALVRYNADGSLDTTFDGDGKLTTPITALSDAIFSVALQTDGKIVAAGSATVSGFPKFSLARYNTDGSLDATFDSDGKRIDAIGTAGVDQPNSMVLQADGKIVVAGGSSNGTDFDFSLARYNTDGSLDTTFDGDGKRIDPVGTGSDQINGVVLQADGKIVVAGYSQVGGTEDFALARYNTNGDLDSTFDTDGKLTTQIGTGNERITSMVLQADGKIVVAGYSSNGANDDFALARYTTSGALDTTFGSGGKVITAIGTGADRINGMVLQADGKIVVVGSSSIGGIDDFALARYNADGSLDTTLGGSGFLTFAIGASTDVANAVQVQADGSITTAGYSHNGPNLDFALVRVVGAYGVPDTVAAENAPFQYAIRADAFTDPEGGSLTYTTSALPSWLDFDAITRTFSGTPGNGDTGVVLNITVTATDADNLFVNDSFAINVVPNDVPVLTPMLPDPGFDGDGKLTTPIGTGADVATSTVIQADGKIVAAGYSFINFIGANNYDFALARYNANGTLDTTFDGDGKIVTPFGTLADQITGVALQADGKIVVAGFQTHVAFADFDFALARYNSDGALDTTFGSGGKVTTSLNPNGDTTSGVVLQSNGKIVVAGTSNTNGTGIGDDFALARYDTNGILDTTFDGDGKLTTAIGTGNDRITSVVLQADGKIVVAGYSSNGTDDFALVRYNTDGTLDSTFDGDGKLTVPIGTGQDQISSVVIQADGKIVVAGSSNNGASSNDFALARFNTDGSLDTTFDGDGKLVTVLGTDTDTISSMLLQPDGKIVVAGRSWNGTKYDFAVVRYNSNGSLDTTFDGDGKFTAAISTGFDIANSLALQSDGSIVVAGEANGDFGLLRLRSFIPNQVATEDSPFISALLAIDTFIDPEGSLVTYSASRADGSALPTWLNFLPVAGITPGSIIGYSFSGTPLNADVGSLSVKLTAADNWGATSSTTFTINVTNTNDAPVVSVPISDKSVFITSTFNYTVPLSTFTDVDAGDVLTYSAKQVGGFDLPAWLTFNPTTRNFSGVAPPEEAGEGYLIEVKVTDTGNATATETFTLQVNGSYVAGTDGVNDTLNGTGADDYIDGKSGADSMTGLAGDDTYIVDNAGDVIIEGGSAGTDRVQASVTYALSNNVENLLLTGVGNINGTGNNLVNEITGNSGNNRLDGGTGIDLLNGGAGNDTYVVDNVNDQVNEGVGAGTDVVEASNAVAGSTFVLSANVENLTLMGATNINAQGNGDPNILTGNSGNNHLIGGSGNDTLNGLGGNDTLDGGAGADSMSGGTGDDLYIVDNAGDATVELASQGIDTVQSSITRTLSANIEHLTLTGVAVINGTGNTLANHIIGNSQNNLLSGGGGTAGDTIEGGDGNDSLTGTEGNDTLDGGQGNDTLIGAGGSDSLDGGSGNGDDSLVGGSGNDTLRGGSGNDTMDGGTGNDVYHVDTASDVVIEAADDSGGTADQVVIAVNFTDEPEVFQLYAGIERVSVFDVNAFVLVTGNDLDNLFDGANGDDSLNGAAGKDTLNGGLGDDTLDGGSGTDTMKGGAGNDLYYVDNLLDVVEETDVAPGALIAAIALVDGFIDTVNAAINYSLQNVALVENLTLSGTATTGSGNELDNQLTGNTLNNTLTGAQGDDTLNGSTGSDIATYAGNRADYQISTVSSTTTVTDLNTGNGDDGSDTLSNIETLRFADMDVAVTVNVNTVTGDSGNNNLVGGSGADSISGNGGNDSLNGAAGNDTLNGNDGDDTLTGSTGDDSLSGGVGVDWAYYNGAGSAVSVNLATAAQNTQGAGTDTLNTIEHVLGSNYHDTLTGNSAANQLDGGAGNDTLDGGSGNDTLKGGGGNDQYTVAQSGDVVIENAGSGTDSVLSSVTHTLAANVEHLTLTGVGNASGNGNTLANHLTGNSGNNTLNGGTGNDTMAGGLGNDTYVVNAAGDVVTEAAAAGTDLVQASTSHTLQANVEHLTLTGAGNSSGNGNTQDNLLTGNSKNNALNGGTGNDTMVGGAGNDTYSVNAAGDQVTEAADAGSDTVNTAINYTLTVNVEHLTQTGSANTTGTGNTLNNKLTGNSGNNTLSGNDGADTLTGGSGADTLTGGANTDIFDYNALTDATDSITDFTAGAGGDKLDIDTLMTALGYNGADPLAAGYVQLLQAGAHTQVNIDSDGGGDNFATTLVTLQNVTATSVTLVDNFIV